MKKWVVRVRYVCHVCHVDIYICYKTSLLLGGQRHPWESSNVCLRVILVLWECLWNTYSSLMLVRELMLMFCCRSMKERRQVLEKNVTVIPNKIMLSETNFLKVHPCKLLYEQWVYIFMLAYISVWLFHRTLSWFVFDVLLLQFAIQCKLHSTQTE